MLIVENVNFIFLKSKKVLAIYKVFVGWRTPQQRSNLPDKYDSPGPASLLAQDFVSIALTFSVLLPENQLSTDLPSFKGTTQNWKFRGLNLSKGSKVWTPQNKNPTENEADLRIMGNFSQLPMQAFFSSGQKVRQLQHLDQDSQFIIKG